MKEPVAYFVEPGNIVRTIWGKSDIILFIFSGAAAEFALNKAVDWLFFTGRLPADPIGRLFSTVQYARDIVFAEKEAAHKTIDKITFIHQAVEKSRGDVIPQWAYRDVLFMLIYYSTAAYELLERKLTNQEKEDLYNVFYRMGKRMNIAGIPPTYEAWLPVREYHLAHDLHMSHYTAKLFYRYRHQLGIARYAILVEAQKLVVPKAVKRLLKLNGIHWLAPAVPLYKFSKMINAQSIIRSLLLPAAYKKNIDALDVTPHA